MGQITTVIFDMYETLAENNSALWVELFGRICADQGLNISGQTLFDKWKPREMQFRKVRLNFEEPEKSPPFKSYEEAWRDCFVEAFEEWLGVIWSDGTATALDRCARRISDSSRKRHPAGWTDDCGHRSASASAAELKRH